MYVQTHTGVHGCPAVAPEENVITLASSKMRCLQGWGGTGMQTQSCKVGGGGGGLQLQNVDLAPVNSPSPPDLRNAPASVGCERVMYTPAPTLSQMTCAMTSVVAMVTLLLTSSGRVNPTL